MRYEYIRCEFDIGNLENINSYSMNGWRVVAICAGGIRTGERVNQYALLERPVPAAYREPR